MDELDILDFEQEKVVQRQGRPVFLTVLCILTFVGGALGILISFLMWISFSAMENVYETFATIQDYNDQYMRQMRWMKFLMLSYIIGNVLCIGGAIVMMFMRKIGFYVYLLGQILPLIIIFIMISGSLSSPGSQIWIVLATIFPLGFVVMYGLNYKSLR